MSRSELIISSGNILNKTTSFGKGSDVATGELFETLQSCLHEYPSKDTLLLTGSSNANAIVEITGNGHDLTSVEGGEAREELKVNVKLFLYSVEEDDICGAVQRALKQTGTTYLDTLVLAFAETPLTIGTLRSVWKVLEKHVQNGQIKTIGLSDIDTELFLEFYNEATVKPNAIQINLASCCVVPPPLQEFCKFNHITLLTHSDPRDILPTDKLEVLTKPLSEQDDKRVKFGVNYVIRYQIHLICRGVISKKGYIVSIGYQQELNGMN